MLPVCYLSLGPRPYSLKLSALVYGTHMQIHAPYWGSGMETIALPLLVMKSLLHCKQQRVTELRYQFLPWICYIVPVVLSPRLPLLLPPWHIPRMGNSLQLVTRMVCSNSLKDDMAVSHPYSPFLLLLLLKLLHVHFLVIIRQQILISCTKISAHFYSITKDTLYACIYDVLCCAYSFVSLTVFCLYKLKITKNIFYNVAVCMYI